MQKKKKVKTIMGQCCCYSYYNPQNRVGEWEEWGEGNKLGINISIINIGISRETLKI